MTPPTLTTQRQYEAAYLLYKRLLEHNIFTPTLTDIERFVSYEILQMRKGPRTLEVMEFTILEADTAQQERELIEFRYSEFQRFLYAESAIKDIIYTHKRNGSHES